MAKYRVIDADGHFMEPDRIWTEYLEPKYHSMAPKGMYETGRYRLSIGGRLSPYLLGPEKALKGTTKMSKGGYVRLADMDKEGIEAMVMYTTTGLFFFGVDSLDLTVALCRAFNNWAHDFCKVEPKRLIAPAIMPQMDVHASIAELRRGVTELGLKGAFLRPNPIGGRTFDHSDWEPFWSLLEELDVPLVLHEGATQEVPQIANARYENFVYRHMTCHPFEQQMALMSLIGSGVLDRHPNLRVVIVEAGCGWAPYWIERMDHHAEEWGYALPAKLSLKPSEYFKRQCFVSADGEEKMLPEYISCLGDDSLLFSTDYPHPDHPFQGVVAGNCRPRRSVRKLQAENAGRERRPRVQVIARRSAGVRREMGILRDKTAIVGIGQTEFGKLLPQSEERLACEAILAALDDAGIKPREVDGFCSYTMETTSEVDIARNIGAGDVTFISQVGYSGGAGCGTVGHAVMAVATGQANVVVAWRSRKRSARGARIWASGTSQVDEAGRWTRPWGLLRPADEIAMLGRRYMHEYGATRECFAAVARAFRKHANCNPHAAMYERTLSHDQYLNARWVSEPLCLFDCCLETDGALAAVIVGRDRARDCRRPPVYVHALAQGFPAQHQAMTNYFCDDPLRSPSWVYCAPLQA